MLIHIEAIESEYCPLYLVTSCGIRIVKLKDLIEIYERNLLGEMKDDFVLISTTPCHLFTSGAVSVLVRIFDYLSGS